LPLPMIDPPPDTTPEVPTLCCSTRVSYPLDLYSFSTTLSNTAVPSCYSQVVQHEC